MGRRLTTSEQRAELERLRVEGASLRAIALEVFGSERLKDRVARELRLSHKPSRPGSEVPLEPDESLYDQPLPDDLPAMRRRVAGVRRQIDERLARGGRVAPSELKALMRVELWLHHAEELEKLNELTRER